MTRPTWGALPALLVLGWAAPAAADDPQLELELDLSAPKPPRELRPTLLVLGVAAGDDDAASAERATALEAELFRALDRSESFRAVLAPSSVTRLGDRAGRARSCADYACFDETSRALQADRAVRLTVERSSTGSLVTLYGYDPGFSAIVTVSQDSQERSTRPARSRAQRNREFLENVGPFLRSSLAKLATPNGRVSLRCSDPGAAVTVDGIAAGLGPQELILQRGLHSIRVTSGGALPFEAQVSVIALQTTRLDARLDPKPPDPSSLPPAPLVPLLRRPGLYVAASGVVLAIVGVILGQIAAGVGAKLSQGGDPVGVTRSQAKAATAEATLANLLVPMGLVAAAGGATWLLLQGPPPSTPLAGGGGAARW